MADRECRNTKKAELYRGGAAGTGAEIHRMRIYISYNRHALSSTVRQGYDSMFDEDVPMEEGRLLH